MIYMSNTTNNQPLDQLKNHLKEKGLFIPVVIAIVALVAGLLIGTIVGGASAENSAKSAPAAKPVPAVTVTATATPAAAEVVEKTTVPEACTQALNEADKGFQLASDMADEFQGAITAIQTNDIDLMKESIRNIKSINTSLGNLSPDYNAHKLVCRAAAE
jgi:hypothetical protein